MCVTDRITPGGRHKDLCESKKKKSGLQCLLAKMHNDSLSFSPSFLSFRVMWVYPWMQFVVLSNQSVGLQKSGMKARCLSDWVHQPPFKPQILVYFTSVCGCKDTTEFGISSWMPGSMYDTVSSVLRLCPFFSLYPFITTWKFCKHIKNYKMSMD